jgi:putative membrane protein
MSILSAQDLTAVEAAIQQAERRTSGEIVVAVLPRCADYALQKAMAALAATGLVTLAGCLGGWPIVGLELLGLQALVYLVALGLFEQPALTRLVASRTVRRRACELRARDLFMGRGIHLTRGRSGVLILVSTLEHEVTILGDAGIHALVGQEGWRSHIEQLSHGIGQGEAKASLIAAVHGLADVLAAHFPAGPQDSNELSNSVVIDAS